MIIDLLKAFFVGGIICAIGQILIDKTSLTPARILVIYVVSGVVLSFFGLYDPIVKFAGAGATIPLTGFGYALYKGAYSGAMEGGIIGAFSGGLAATAGGISAAIFFGYLVALIFKPLEKS